MVTNKIISLSENVSRIQNILVCFSSTLEHRLNKWSTIHPNRIEAQMKCLKAAVIISVGSILNHCLIKMDN